MRPAKSTILFFLLLCSSRFAMSCEFDALATLDPLFTEGLHRLGSDQLSWLNKGEQILGMRKEEDEMKDLRDFYLEEKHLSEIQETLQLEKFLRNPFYFFRSSRRVAFQFECFATERGKEKRFLVELFLQRHSLLKQGSPRPLFPLRRGGYLGDALAMDISWRKKKETEESYIGGLGEQDEKRFWPQLKRRNYHTTLPRKEVSQNIKTVEQFTKYLEELLRVQWQNGRRRDTWNNLKPFSYSTPSAVTCKLYSPEIQEMD